jgi:hypothetical protein
MKHFLDIPYQNKSMKKILILFLLACASTLAYSKVTLAWDPNPETNIAGYILHWGTTSGEYTDSVDVGNVTTYVFTNALHLVHGETYYMVVSAYNTANLDSLPSNEVVFTFDGRPPPITGLGARKNE